MEITKKRAPRSATFKYFMQVNGEYIVGQDSYKWLIDNGFFKAPASASHHGNYEGGLFDHSYAVAKHLVHITEQMGLHWQRPQSPFIVGMFHDLCKIDEYTLDCFGWKHDNEILLKGHGDKSVMLLSTLMQLTEEEMLCIRYHMGAFTNEKQWNDYGRAVEKYPNVLWTHTADMLASRVDGV